MFFKGVQPLRYKEGRISWDYMLELIKARDKQKIFWEFCDELNKVRDRYNHVIMNKFKALPRVLKKNPDVLVLMKDMMAPLNKKKLKKESFVSTGRRNSTDDANKSVELIGDPEHKEQL